MSSSSVQPILGIPPRKLAIAGPRRLEGWFAFAAPLFLFLHAPLALAMREYPSLAFGHLAATTALGLIALLSERRPFRLIYVAAYITGAEVLWRMTNALPIWEFAKYAVSLLLILGLLNSFRFAKASKWPLLYFGLLIPSVLIPSALTEWNRQTISSNLSGPFSLAAAAMFFSTVRLGRPQILRTLVVIAAPLVGVATLSFRSIVGAESIAFTENSNVLTSGGFGPNQVSSMLGLGAVAAFLFLVHTRQKGLLRTFMLTSGLILAVLAVLTFSRGGPLTALGAIAVAVFYLCRRRRLRLQLLVGGGLVYLLGSYVIYPFVDDFTGGVLTRRFMSLDPTGRDKLVEGDLLAFRQNPLLGTGPGGSRRYHAMYFRPAQAHTEFSRLLAEHGVFGLAALGVLLGMTWRKLRAPASVESKAFAACLTAWAFLFMQHAAMRLVAPSFLYGLATAVVILRKNQSVVPDLTRTGSGRLVAGRRARPMTLRRSWDLAEFASGRRGDS